MSLPALHAEVFHTEKGTPYLKEPGVVMIAKPQVDIVNIAEFLDGFDDSLEFHEYIHDHPISPIGGFKRPDAMGNGARLCKLAGQLCYMSFGPKRTKNKDAKKYFDNIISSGHGSVLEHANYSFLLYGISRSLTHELVRHRVGVAFSQVSQRYVDGSKLRFVERPEFSTKDYMHHFFERRIDDYVQQYDAYAQYLMAQLRDELEGLSKTDARKRVNQAARAMLPNETEAPMVFTGNVRELRHILDMRGSSHAEVEIRALAAKLFLCLKEVEPILFMDYELKDGVVERV